MSRALNADASICIPRMVPWRDWDEWYRVKALLFSPEPFFRCQGVQHVAVWRNRERIPHAVETTSQLVEVRLNDAGPAESGVACARRSEEELRLVYSAVVIRAVNGLTGHEQKTAHAAPVSSLARGIGLPPWLVDIRHEAAHKQLPGIVILRLATDFLLDYLWRRYWGPQAEHLDFVWDAFDQLICRYKATSETDASLSCNAPGAHRSCSSPPLDPCLSSPSLPASKKRRTDSTTRVVVGAAPSAGAQASKKSEAVPRRGLVSPHTPRGEASAVWKPSSGAAATERAAREMALSVTPTALAWALVSLLADGGTAQAGAGSGGSRKRGQGHLLPRSKERYPAPGAPGVDGGEVSRRITGRWATLLNTFHVRWRGFGAALLVRLVETLLGNAARGEAEPSGDAGLAGHPSSGGVGGGVGGSSSRGGLERQAAFIELWVRHLLSRRWHLRVSDMRVRSALRSEAVGSGLSPTFCEEEEASWEEEESAWADEPAPPGVLRAALFPLHELLERCRRSLATLAVQPPATAATFTADADDRQSANAHWAKAGLDHVCDALADALAGGRGRAFIGSREDSDDGAAAAGASTPHPCTGSDGALGASEVAAAGSLVRASGAAVDSGGERPQRDPAPDGGRSGGGGGGDSHNAGSVDAVTGAGSGAAAGMIDLDSLELLLGADSGPSARFPGAPAAFTSVAESAAGGTAKVDRDDEVTDGKRLDEEEDPSWELVEKWTPCAIGTLPGWSCAGLHRFS